MTNEQTLAAAALGAITPDQRGGEILFDIRKDSIRQTPQGFWEIDASASRIGVQTYVDAMSPNGMRREYRSPEEVFAPESLATYRQAPVTKDHPPEMVTAANMALYGKGISVGDPRVEGDLVWITLLITHEDLIDLIRKGELTQVSCGYACVVLEQPGVSPEGEVYSHIQTKIRINHIAVVKYGRGGPRVCLHLDSGETYYAGVPAMPHADSLKPGRYAVKALEGDEPEMETDGFKLYEATEDGLNFLKDMTKKGPKPMAEMTLGGAKFDGIPAEVVAPIQAEIKTHADRADAAERELADLKAKQADAALLQVNLDSATDQIKTLQASLEAAGGADVTSKAQAIAKIALDSYETVAPYLPADFKPDFKFDGSDEITLKLEAIKANGKTISNPDDPASVRARFDYLQDEIKASGASPAFQPVLNAAKPNAEGRADGAPKMTAYDRMIADLNNPQGDVK